MPQPNLLQGKNRDKYIEDAIVNTVEWGVAEMSLETSINIYTLLLLLILFSHVRLCATPQTAAHLAPRSLGFSRKVHWSGLPFPSPMHESEK